jgi:hypothetical protein
MREGEGVQKMSKLTRGRKSKSLAHCWEAVRAMLVPDDAKARSSFSWNSEGAALNEQTSQNHLVQSLLRTFAVLFC